MSMIQLTAPYIAGYLAFREADFLVEKIEKLKNSKPDIMPQVSCKLYIYNEYFMQFQ